MHADDNGDNGDNNNQSRHKQTGANENEAIEWNTKPKNNRKKDNEY